MRQKFFGIMLKTYLMIFGVVGAVVFALNRFAPGIKGAIMV